MTFPSGDTLTFASIVLAFTAGFLAQRLLLNARIRYYRKELKDLSRELMQQSRQELGL